MCILVSPGRQARLLANSAAAAAPESCWPAGSAVAQHVFEISIRVVTIEPGALNQANHRGTTLGRTTGAGEQPAVAADVLKDPAVHKLEAEPLCRCRKVIWRKRRLTSL